MEATLIVIMFLTCIAANLIVVPIPYQRSMSFTLKCGGVVTGGIIISLVWILATKILSSSEPAFTKMTLCSLAVYGTMLLAGIASSRESKQLLLTGIIGYVLGIGTTCYMMFEFVPSETIIVLSTVLGVILIVISIFSQYHNTTRVLLSICGLAPLIAGATTYDLWFVTQDNTPHMRFLYIILLLASIGIGVLFHRYVNTFFPTNQSQ